MVSMLRDCADVVDPRPVPMTGKVGAHEIHNRLAPEIVTRIVKETGGESDAMVVLESVVLGIMLYYRPKVREAGEFMDSMTAAVIDRMKA